MIDGETITFIRREIERQLNIILIATAANSSDQTEDIEGLFVGMDTIPGRQKMQPYGLTSRAPAGTPSVVAQQGSGSINRFVLGHRHDSRPQLANEGEVMLYDAFENQIYLQKGKIVIDSKEIDLTKNPTDAVSLASLVKGELGKISTALSGLTAPAGGGPVTGNSYLVVGNVASTKVKAS